MFEVEVADRNRSTMDDWRAFTSSQEIPATDGVGFNLDADGRVGDACTAVTDFIVSLGPFMPSVYLERGGRLRCQASRRYWQVLDGFPPVSGVIARTYRTGEPAFLEDVDDNADYLAAVPGVRSEAAVPILVSDVVVGVLNVESTSPMKRANLELFRDLAAELGRKLTELGGPPQESRWQRLSRYASNLAGLLEREEIEAGALDALCSLSRMDSGMIVRLDDDGSVIGMTAVGALGPELEKLPPASLETIASWVESASSCYSLGDPDDLGFTGQDSLRTLGVNAVIVLALGARHRRLGFLLAANRLPTMPPTEEVELLELLASQTATCLQTADAVEQMRRRADLDPLTGLGHHAFVRGRPGRGVRAFGSRTADRRVDRRCGRVQDGQRLQGASGGGRSPRRDGCVDVRGVALGGPALPDRKGRVRDRATGAGRAGGRSHRRAPQDGRGGVGPDGLRRCRRGRPEGRREGPLPEADRALYEAKAGETACGWRASSWTR